VSRAYRRIPFSDDLLADGTVRRIYSDGRQEWRRHGFGGVVTWLDSAGRVGIDEPRANRVVLRLIAPNTMLYGRDAGFGRTAWSDGVLTVNETSLKGLLIRVLAVIGAARLLPMILDPPRTHPLAEDDRTGRVPTPPAAPGPARPPPPRETWQATSREWASRDRSVGEDYG
jgi:hypothetical protein